MLNRWCCLLLCFSLLGCQSETPELDIQTNNSHREVEQGLVLYNATLEQSNAKGQTLWKLSTEKAVYDQEQKIARLENITGNLFNNGELILQVSAKKGEIQRDGKEFSLKEGILATDPRNKAELRGDELEWRPEEHLLILKENIKANHAKLVSSAKEGKYNTKTQVLELIGDIMATATNPPLQLKTEHLYWQISQDKVIGDRPLEMVRYRDKIITDRLTTQKAEVDLEKKTALIEGNIEYQSLEPPLQAATSKILWQYQERVMLAQEPIELKQTKDNMTLTANQASVYLEKKMAYLERGIYGEAAQKEAKIYADNLVWDIEKKAIEATGNVYYEQIDPEFNLTGVRALGKLQDKSMVVSGDYQRAVITTIYPEGDL